MNLVQIVDGAMAEAVRRSGSWLVCKAGCAECCIGPFPISMQDATRLRAGLAELSLSDPARASAIRRRAAALDLTDDDAACPVLDPESLTCDLYSHRPITCRLFGPAVRMNDGPVGVCELNYNGASDEEIAACVVDVEMPEEPEGETLVAHAIIVA